MENQSRLTFDEVIILKYLKGETTLEEEKRLYEWLQSSAENRRLFAEIKLMSHRCHDEQPRENEQEQMEHSLSQLNARIDSWQAPKKTFHYRRWGRIAIAASFTLLLGFAVYQHSFITSVLQNPVYTYNNPDTNSLHLLLKDGTNVWLSHGSTLTFDKAYGTENRSVNLNGEAYFDVKKDLKHPFVVKTNSIQVKVLGTMFNVRAYEADSIAEAVLVKGSICLQDADHKNLIYLKPGQQALYMAQTSELQVNEVDTSVLALRFGLVSMADADLESIVSKIEETYGVRLKIKNAYEHSLRYDFNFLRTSQLEEVIEILEYVSDNKIEIIY